ncbi:MAG: EAL domain-containing protein [Oscillospiraceae bacterium]|nr:EAL domain-containing protein [Oscillospiraceae bacterium]
MLRRLTPFAVAAFACVLLAALPSYAEGTSGVGEASPAADAPILVAGCRDGGPIEYYDEETGAFAGIMPDLLEEIGRRTGLEFQYVAPPAGGGRRELAENLQVEIVSAVKDDGEFDGLDLQRSDMGLTYEAEGESRSAYFAFTRLASPELIQSFNEALEEVLHSDEMNRILMGYAVENGRGENLGWTAVLIGAVFLAAVVSITALARKNRVLMHEQRYTELFDDLTGVWNLDHFCLYYDRQLTDSQRAEYSVVYFSEDFKQLYDRYGTEEVNHFLKYMAHILARNMGDGGMLCRMENESFVLARKTASQGELETWAARVLDKIDAYPVVFSKDYEIGIHAGIYSIQKEDRFAQNVIYYCKEAYKYALKHKLSYAICGKDILNEMQEQDQLISMASEAFRTEQFAIYAQPYVSLSEDGIYGCEALVRWNHPTKGLLKPDKFISLFEGQGTILDLDLYLFERVCRWQQQRNIRGEKKMVISCNFSRFDFASPLLAEKLIEILNRYTVDPRQIAIEITESVVQENNATAQRNIEALRRMNFSIYLDDFGSGSTSYSDLKNYPIDILKLDRSLLLMADNEKGAVILDSIVSLGHRLNFSIVCEGAETEEQIALLRKLKCDYIQGFYYYRPMPLSEADKLMDK